MDYNTFNIYTIGLTMEGTWSFVLFFNFKISKLFGFHTKFYYDAQAGFEFLDFDSPASVSLLARTTVTSILNFTLTLCVCVSCVFVHVCVCVTQRLDINSNKRLTQFSLSCS